MYVLAGEQLAGDGFCKTITAAEETVGIVVADAFYAFFLTRSFYRAKSTGHCRIKSRTTVSKPYLSRFVISMLN